MGLGLSRSRPAAQPFALSLLDRDCSTRIDGHTPSVSEGLFSVTWTTLFSVSCSSKKLPFQREAASCCHPPLMASIQVLRRSMSQGQSAPRRDHETLHTLPRSLHHPSGVCLCHSPTDGPPIFKINGGGHPWDVLHTTIYLPVADFNPHQKRSVCLQLVDLSGFETTSTCAVEVRRMQGHRRPSERACTDERRRCAE